MSIHCYRTCISYYHSSSKTISTKVNSQFNPVFHMAYDLITTANDFLNLSNFVLLCLSWFHIDKTRACQVIIKLCTRTFLQSLDLICVIHRYICVSMLHYLQRTNASAVFVTNTQNVFAQRLCVGTARVRQVTEQSFHVKCFLTELFTLNWSPDRNISAVFVYGHMYWLVSWELSFDFHFV